MIDRSVYDNRLRKSNKCYTCSNVLDEGVYVSCSKECKKVYERNKQRERIVNANMFGNTMFFARKKMKALRYKCKNNEIALGIDEFFVSQNREKLKNGIYRKDPKLWFVEENIIL